MARVGVGIGFDQDGEHIPLDRIGDPGLGAVDDIVVAVLRTARALNTPAGRCRRRVRSARCRRAMSPVANFGRYSRFISSVAKRSTAAAMIRCELKMPETDIQTDCHALDDFGIGFDVQAQAAVFRRDRGADTSPARPACRRPVVRIRHRPLPDSRTYGATSLFQELIDGIQRSARCRSLIAMRQACFLSLLIIPASLRHPSRRRGSSNTT